MSLNKTIAVLFKDYLEYLHSTNTLMVMLENLANNTDYIAIMTDSNIECLNDTLHMLRIRRQKIYDTMITISKLIR